MGKKKQQKDAEGPAKGDTTGDPSLQDVKLPKDKNERGKKTYSLSKNELSGATDEKIPKVSIAAKLETEIVDLIQREHERKQSWGDLSKRLTTKKLTDVYNSLSEAGFSQKQIESAMTVTVAGGGDLIDALDWLCLHTPHDRLPAGFSVALHREEVKHRPKFDHSLVSESATATPKPPPSPQASNKPATPKPAAQSTASVKDWILKYAEQDSDEDEEDDKDDEEFDPNSRYLELTAKLLDAKEEAVAAKLDNRKKKHQALSKQIREMTIELECLETSPGFNPAVKIKMERERTAEAEARRGAEAEARRGAEAEARRGAEAGAKTGAVAGADMRRTERKEEEEEDMGLGMFAAAENQTSAPKPAGKLSKPEDVVMSFEYTRQQWTGKSPKQFLIDWVRKHLPKADPPKFHKITVRGKFKSRVVIDKKGEGVLQWTTEGIVTENAKEAEHLAATLALYHLCRGQSVHQLLPPTYRGVWLDWLEAEKQAKEAAVEKQNKPRDQFVAKLLKKLKPGDSASAAETPSSETTESNSKTSDDNDDNDDSDNDEDAGDTWEALAEDDDTDDDPPDAHPPPAPFPSPPPPSAGKPRGGRPMGGRGMKSADLAALVRRRQKSEPYQQLLETRRQLPVFQHRQEVLEAVETAKVVVVAGETGSGKSTQIPQFLLEDKILRGQGDTCNILCTQPRRISAMSLARRVCEEMGDSSAGAPDALCGYQMRFETRRGPNTRLLYCTTGIVLRQLQNDAKLSHVSHIIVDEVHERSVDSDFLLIVVKKLLSQRSELKVILMSATLDSEKFSRYFFHCPVINIPGRTFPVQVFHLEDVVEMTGYVVEEDSPYCLKERQLVEEDQASVEVTGRGGTSSQVNVHWTKENISRLDMTELSVENYSLRTRNAVTRLNPNRVNLDLIVSVLLHLEESERFQDVPGAVLIFLPGLSHIQELHEMLTTDRRFANERRYRILALHSVLSSDNQSQAFLTPPHGIRKIVLATNIAETGITIPDVVFVIDSGKAKENRYSEASQMSVLQEVFVSKANCRQRQGRAGRVCEGVCFRLYTQDKFEKLREFSVPELLRVPLEGLCLSIMKCSLGKPEEFLGGALDPPPTPALLSALCLLEEVGACEPDRLTLTPLGQHLASLPVHVRIGKMLLYAAMLGCLQHMAVIAAAMTDKSPFAAPLSKKGEADSARMALAMANSDHLTVLRAYRGWEKACSQGGRTESAYCSRFFLKRSALIDMQNVSSDLVKLVHSIGFGTSEEGPPPRSKVTLGSGGGQFNLDPPQLDSGLVAMVKAVLTAGLYPKVARVSYTAPVDAGANPETAVCVAETPQGPVALHPTSVNRRLKASGWLVFHEKVKLSRVYLRDATLTSPYPLLLFGGSIDVQHTQQLVSIDSWLQFRAVAKTGVMFKEMRKLLRTLLHQKIIDPSFDISGNPVIDIIKRLLMAER